jgi:hypothetical protein
MDKDTDERIVQNGLYREALNISVATSEDSDVGAAQNILGNIQVTEAIQSRSYQGTQGDNLYAGDNYHVASITNPQTNMLYRFIHTASSSQGIWMDRIVEFDTSKKLSDPWHSKEKPVFVDIFKVSTTIDELESVCTGGEMSKLSVTSNLNQIRWGMLARFPNGEEATVINVDYTLPGVIMLDKSLTPQTGGIVEFYGDRNLNFGDTNNIKNITGINIIDDMIFWTDNTSEPKKINIERSKIGSSGTINTHGGLNAGRGTSIIDNFNQHTLLVVNDIENPLECVFQAHSCDIAGCTDPTACNYDPLATSDDGSCAGTYGCMDATAINYDVTADCDDGSCCFISGCTDLLACNYNANACVDDGSCTYPDGCTDPHAENYDPSALCDDGSCTYCINDCNQECNGAAVLDNCGNCVGGSTGNSTVYGCMDATACNYNPNATCNIDNNGGVHTPCILPDGCTNQLSCNYDPSALCDDGSCIPLVKGCDDPLACNYDPLVCFNDGTCTYGDGCTDPYACNHDASANCDDGSCCYVSGCMDPTACNYDSLACCDDGSCIIGTAGCMNPAFCNYDPTAVCDDGSCAGTPGCTDDTACNYNSAAACDDGSCSGLLGCMDTAACNYDPNATCWVAGICEGVKGCTDPTACTYDPNADCDDGSCSGLLGCTGKYACNYNPNATCDDGSCTGVRGCDDPSACNYDPKATCSWPPGHDFGCFGIRGCTDKTACNYNPRANCDDGSCQMTRGCMDPSYCEYDRSATCDDGQKKGSLWGKSCKTLAGCMDRAFCEFDINARCGDKRRFCKTLIGCTDPNSCNYDPKAKCDPKDPNDHRACQGIVGCTDPLACNYDAKATCSCSGKPILEPPHKPGTKPGKGKGRGKVVGRTAMIPDILGCTNPLASNYDRLANVDDGSCILHSVDGGSCCVYDGCDRLDACNYDPLAVNCSGGVNKSCAPERMGCMDPCFEEYDLNNKCGCHQWMEVHETKNGAGSDPNYDYQCCWNKKPNDCNGDCGGGASLACYDGVNISNAPNSITGQALCTGGNSSTVLVSGCTDCGTIWEGNNPGQSCPPYPVNPNHPIGTSGANNFNPLATCHDGSCDYGIYGCTDPTMSNYNPAATVDDGSCCITPWASRDCAGKFTAMPNHITNFDDASGVSLSEHVYTWLSIPANGARDESFEDIKLRVGEIWVNSLATGTVGTANNLHTNFTDVCRGPDFTTTPNWMIGFSVGTGSNGMYIVRDWDTPTPYLDSYYTSSSWNDLLLYFQNDLNVPNINLATTTYVQLTATLEAIWGPLYQSGNLPSGSPTGQPITGNWGGQPQHNPWEANGVWMNVSGNWVFCCCGCDNPRTNGTCA